MNKKTALIIVGVLIAIAALLIFKPGKLIDPQMGGTSPPLNELIAQIVSATGTVTVLHSDGKTDAAAPNMPVKNGDEIWTRDTGEASVEFFAGSRVALWHDTRLKIDRASVDGQRWEKQTVNLRLESGRIWSRILKLLDADSEYSVSVNNVIASVRGTAFQTSVNGPIVQLDQFDGDLDVTGGATGTLRTGLTASFNTLTPGITIAASHYFPPDQTRNDHWIRAQLRLDEEFARRAGKIRHGAGVDENLSSIGSEAGPFTLDQPGVTHSNFRGVSLDLNGADERNVVGGGAYQLKALALLEKPDGSLEQRDITDLATWQTSDPTLAAFSRNGLLKIQTAAATGTFQVIARWNDGTHEHSNTHAFSILPQSGTTNTTIDTTIGPIMINGKPLQ